MTIFYFDLYGSASIGVYSLVTDDIMIVPPQVTEERARKLEEWLKIPVIRTTIGESVLIGSLASANSSGIILPHYVRKEEIHKITSCIDINFVIMETRRTAYGNLILTNDYGALADPRIKDRDIKRIAETLSVDVVKGEIAGLTYVGSLATATNKGVLAHPLLKDEEREILKDVLKVHVDVGTINCGIPYVATGLVSNTSGAIVGSETTGPELFIIGQTLDLVKSGALSEKLHL